MKPDTDDPAQSAAGEEAPRKRGRPRKYTGTAEERALQALRASRTRQKGLYYASLAERKEDRETKIIEGREPFSTLLTGSEIGFLRREAARDGVTIAEFLSRLINDEWDRRADAAYLAKVSPGTAPD